jgi:hypothetical protein
MAQFLVWLQASALGHLMREAGVWTYAAVNLIHILGVATLFGSVLVLDLKLLGMWPRITLRTVSEPTVPIAVIGFLIAAISGAGLLATKATEYQGNPFFYIKFSAIGLGLLNALLLNRLPEWRERDARTPALKMAGAISLLCWFIALSAGRLIGYW